MKVNVDLDLKSVKNSYLEAENQLLGCSHTQKKSVGISTFKKSVNYLDVKPEIQLLTRIFAHEIESLRTVGRFPAKIKIPNPGTSDSLVQTYGEKKRRETLR